MNDSGQSAQIPPGDGRRPLPRGSLMSAALAALIAAAVSLLSILVLVPVNGVLPSVGLDLSWPYTLADAVARRIPFGRDMVFTFGPLSSLYTRFFLPDQRLAFIAAKAVLVLAFCLGAVAISRRSLRWAALFLPVLLANLTLTDSFFLAAPWLIVPLAAAPWNRQRLHAAGLAALAAVLGPLLLVKGTLAIPVAVSIGAATLVAARRSRTAAAALPIAAIASIVVAWLATGQRLPDLPLYLRRETAVAAGYTDAMSQFGDPREIWIYLAGAAALLATQLAGMVTSRRRWPRPSAMAVLAGAAILFVAFKAGFVRHDGHAAIAGGTLALLALLMFLHRGGFPGGLGLAAGLAAWLTIGADYWPVDPATSWNRFTDAVTTQAGALHAAVRDPDAFRRDFDAAKATIAAAADLPPTSGTVDLYPDDQELLLGSNRGFYPRPVVQSYSAYTPALARLNADHLAGRHAPDTAFFDITPLDGRYPSLEDGPSWPALLGQYRFRGFARNYAVLDRVAGASPATVGPVLSAGAHLFGEEVPVPQDVPFVWARFRFHPTGFGRLASALFKLPIISIEATTAGGQTRTFRLVAGMAEAGFLLSPTVESARDFAALRSTAVDALATQRVASIRLLEDGDLALWGRRYTVEFSPMRIPTDPAVDDAVLGHVEAGPPVDTLPTSGECIIDSVGGMPAASAPIAVAGSTTVKGWGYAAEGPGRRAGRNLRIAVTSDDGSTVYAAASREPRPDVDAVFHLAPSTDTGFAAQVNLGGVDGPATLRVVQDGPAGPAACGAPVAILRDRRS